jgi:AraC-like DNA-binding protein
VQIAAHVSHTPLGPMTVSIWRPPRFAGLVSHLWHCDGPLVDRRERVLPNGRFELVLALGDRHHRVDDARTSPLPAASFGGMRTRPLVLDHPGRCDTLGIVLTPAGAYGLLARPLCETDGATLDARDLIRETDVLASRCAEGGTPADRFAVVARWLANRFARGKAPDPAIAWMAAQIERGGSELRVGALRKETGLSKARLIGRFREQIGAPPKLYARLVRFRHVLDALARPDVRLTDVALDAGYYDQAHMTTEFRELAGITPTAFRAARYREGSGNTARDPA